MSPGTRRLSDLARHVVVPSGIVSTGWPAVRDRCRDLGIEFDPWQDGAGRLILSKRADGSYAASIGGVVISIPRQVGKTFLVGAIVFALCLLNPGLTVIWTAHRSRTAAETFQAMQGFARRPQIAPHVAKVVLGSGEEEVRFTNGSRVLFGARERGFGRGFTLVHVIVFDEAQILTENAIDDMVPATNQAENPLLLFTGTPPKPSDPSEVFSTKREDALSGDVDDTVYLEFSADHGCDPMSRAQWAKANPSFPKRTNEAAILRMRKNLSADSFRREALGIWDPVQAGASVIDADLWASRVVAEAPLGGSVAYGVKFSPDGSLVALSVALRPIEGPVHVEGVAHRKVSEGTRWLRDWLGERWDGAAAVVIDGKAGAGAFLKSLERAGMKGRKMVAPSSDQVVTAHSMFLTAVTDGGLSHIDDPVLSGSIASAGRRPIGTAGGWGFRSLDGGDVTLAESAVMAHYGASTARKSTRPGGRKVVVLQ